MKEPDPDYNHQEGRAHQCINTRKIGGAFLAYQQVNSPEGIRLGTRAPAAHRTSPPPLIPSRAETTPPCRRQSRWPRRSGGGAWSGRDGHVW